jgi:hypothetical protein
MKRSKFMLTLSAMLMTSVLVAAEPAPTEIVIIATDHFMSDMEGDTSPAHLRALLERVKPDIFAVEAPVNVPNPMANLPFEAWNITKPWADQRKILLQPVDWLVENNQQRLGIMVQTIMQGPHSSDFQKLETDFQTRLQTMRGFEAQQQPAYAAMCRDYWRQIRLWSDGKTTWDERGEKIAANIRALSHEQPGKRIAVLFGAMHSFDLTDRLAGQSDIRLLPAASFLPLSNDELEHNALPSDYVLAMRRLNFPPGAPIVGRLEGIESALDRMARVPSLALETKFYRARLLLHRFRWAEGAKAFEELAQEPVDRKLATTDAVPVAAMAKINRAIALNVLGQNGEAIQSLDSALENKDLPQTLRIMAEDLKRGFRGKKNP